MSIWCLQETHIILTCISDQDAHIPACADLLFTSDPTLSFEKTFLPAGNSNHVAVILVLLCLGHCGMFLFNLQSRIICGLSGMVFVICTKMYTGMTYLNIVLQLILREIFLPYISRVEGTRLSLVR